MELKEPSRVSISRARKLTVSPKAQKSFSQEGFNLSFYSSEEEREENLIAKLFIDPSTLQTLIEYLTRAKQENSSLFSSPGTTGKE